MMWLISFANHVVHLIGISLLSLMVDLVASRGGEPLYGLFFIALVLVTIINFFSLLLNPLALLNK